MSQNEEKFILSVDIGTTLLRCHIYNKLAQIVGQSSSPIEMIYPKQGWAEFSPDQLWESFVSCVKQALKDSNLKISQIASMAISTQRGTFTTWDRESGQTFHNFITWKDIRSSSLCEQWNNSFRIKALKAGANLLHFFTRSHRFLAGSLMKFTTGMAVIRLIWVLENLPQVKQKAIEGKAMFGTVDTYLVWKLTGGKVHATDASNACVTGMFDPFRMKWMDWVMNMFHIPYSMLPIVQDTNGSFGETLAEIFGVSIPICCLVGDQQAAMFGECCFEVGDVKCTLGTGSFININTGTIPYASYHGLYPVVGWKLAGIDKANYLAEGASYDTGTAIDWAHKIALFDDANETSDLAKSVLNSGGVYFIPAFSGLQAPINDASAIASFIGLSPSTTKAHMVRAILESLTFRIKQMYEIILQEADFKMNHFRVNGGVSNNDFVIQLIADLTGKEVDRACHRDMSSLGAAFLAGLSIGMWKDCKELAQLRKSEKVFLPQDTWGNHYKQVLSEWEKACDRCLNWYN